MNDAMTRVSYDRNTNGMAQGDSQAKPDVETAVDSQFREIVGRICDGSENAMEEFVDKFGSHMQRYVRKKLNEQLRLRVRFDTQDFVQMVWVSFFADREVISQFKTADQLVWYLITMARNKVISEMRHSEGGKGGDVRRTRSLTSLNSRQAEELRSKEATPSHFAVARDQLRRLLSESSDRDRQIVKLRMSGKTFEEIANELEIDERTVRRAVSRLVKMIVGQPAQDA